MRSAASATHTTYVRHDMYVMAMAVAVSHAACGIRCVRRHSTLVEDVYKQRASVRASRMANECGYCLATAYISRLCAPGWFLCI